MVDLLLTKHIISLSYYLASFFFYLYPFLISFYLLFYLFLLKSCIITFQYHFIRLFIFFLLLFVSFAIFLTLYSVIYDTCISLPHCVLSLSLPSILFDSLTRFSFRLPFPCHFPTSCSSKYLLSFSLSMFCPKGISCFINSFSSPAKPKPFSNRPHI